MAAKRSRNASATATVSTGDLAAILSQRINSLPSVDILDSASGRGGSQRGLMGSNHTNHSTSPLTPASNRAIIPPLGSRNPLLAYSLQPRSLTFAADAFTPSERYGPRASAGPEPSVRYGPDTLWYDADSSAMHVVPQNGTQSCSVPFLPGTGVNYSPAAKQSPGCYGVSMSPRTSGQHACGRLVSSASMHDGRQHSAMLTTAKDTMDMTQVRSYTFLGL